MNRDELLELLHRVEEISEQEILEDGWVNPAFLIFHQGQGTMIALDPSGMAIPAYKDEAADLVKVKLAELRADAYAFISESWVAKQDKDEPYIPPSKREDRREVVFITIETPNLQLSSNREIIRDSEGKVTGLKPNDIDNTEGGSLGGRFANLFAEV